MIRVIVLGSQIQGQEPQDPGSRIRNTAGRGSYLDLEISIIVKKNWTFLVTQFLLSFVIRIWLQNTCGADPLIRTWDASWSHWVLHSLFPPHIHKFRGFMLLSSLLITPSYTININQQSFIMVCGFEHCNISTAFPHITGYCTITVSYFSILFTL